nr:TIGR02300 family protein [Roseibium limicola]
MGRLNSKRRRVSTVAKPELGTKRLCASCGAKYYDLNRDPIVCPKCGTVFEAVQATRAVQTSRAAKASKVVAETDDDDDEEDDSGPEIVSLEEADAEAEGTDGDDVPDIDGDDDLDDDDDADDDVFIEDEEEDEEAVPGIRVEIDEDET